MKSVPGMLTAAVLVLCAAGLLVPLAIPVRSTHRSPAAPGAREGTPAAAPSDWKAGSSSGSGRATGSVSIPTAAGMSGGSGAGEGAPGSPGAGDPRTGITGAIVRFLAPRALAARLGRVAARARAGSRQPERSVALSGQGRAVARTPRSTIGRSGSDLSGKERPPRTVPETGATPALPRAAALERIATLFGEAYVTRATPQASPGAGARLRARPDNDPLAEALDLLQVCFEGEEREALERQLLEWAGQLEQLLAAADLDLETLNAQGQEALAGAQEELQSRLQHQHDELVRVLRATGKRIPDDRVDLDAILSPERLAETMRKLRELGDRPN